MSSVRSMSGPNEAWESPALIYGMFDDSRERAALVGSGIVEVAQRPPARINIDLVMNYLITENPLQVSNRLMVRSFILMATGRQKL